MSSKFEESEAKEALKSEAIEHLCKKCTIKDIPNMSEEKKKLIVCATLLATLADSITHVNALCKFTSAGEPKDDPLASVKDDYKKSSDSIDFWYLEKHAQDIDYSRARNNALGSDPEFSIQTYLGEEGMLLPEKREEKEKFDDQRNRLVKELKKQVEEDTKAEKEKAEKAAAKKAGNGGTR